MSNKQLRQNRIKEILRNQIISSHEEMVKALRAEGIQVTQATLSRDFAEMGVVRTFTDGKVRYNLNTEDWGAQISKLISFEILNVEMNEYCVLLRTIAGRAQGVAHYIDRLNKPEILGTIGGVDTVVVIPNGIKNTQLVYEYIKEIIRSS